MPTFQSREDEVRELLQERFDEQAIQEDEKITVLHHGTRYSCTSKEIFSYFLIEFKKRRPDNGEWLKIQKKFYRQDSNTSEAYQRFVLEMRIEMTNSTEFINAQEFTEEYLNHWYEALKQRKSAKTVRVFDD